MLCKYSNSLVVSTTVLTFYPLFSWLHSSYYYFITVQHEEFTLSLNFQGDVEVY